MECPNCGRLNNVTARQCECGHQLTSEQSAQQLQAGAGHQPKDKDIRRAKGKVTVWGVFATLSVIVMIGLLAYYAYTLDQRVKALEASVANINASVANINSDIWSLASGLSTVRAIARNADSYSHSHYSDRRLKRNIATNPADGSNWMQLRAVTYEWNDTAQSDLGLPQGQQIGLIAQEVEQLYPSLVTTNANGFKTIDYAGLSVVLITAVQSQQVAIERLEQDNADLAARLAALELAGVASEQ